MGKNTLSSYIKLFLQVPHSIDSPKPGSFSCMSTQANKEMGFQASSKERTRDALFTWYSHLSHHDLDQLIISSITLPLYEIITVHLRFGGQSYNLKYFLPLFSKVHQYQAIETTSTKHLSRQTLHRFPDISFPSCFCHSFSRNILHFFLSNFVCHIPSLPKPHHPVKAFLTAGA